MTGSTTDYKYRGLMARTISSLYQQIEQRYDQNITVSISYLEDYNEQLADLLRDTVPDYNHNTLLKIEEDNYARISVKNQIVRQCNTEDEAQQLIFEGVTQRTIDQHQLNRASSRSHCVFTIHLEIRSKVESKEKVIISKINLVDLAGSERTKKTSSSGITMTEAQFINKSLSFLEQVVVALSEKHREHIPYRSCKLTNLLKDSIGGNSKTIMIANIFPESSHLEETISTLKFASRIMKVANETTVQLKLDPNVLLKKYEKEIKDLRQELAMHDTLSNRGRIQYEAYTSEQQYQVQQQAKEFLHGDDDVEFDSLRQVKELFFQFRNIYKGLQKDVENRNFVPMENDSKVVKQQVIQQKKEAQDKVGVEEKNTGFGLGKARDDAKPTSNVQNLVNIQRETFEETAQETKQEEQLKQSRMEEQQTQRIVNVDKKQVYEIYCQNEGLEAQDKIAEMVNDLKEKKQEIKVINNQCQDIKTLIDSFKLQYEKKQDNKNQEEVLQAIIDVEEYDIMKNLKEQKKQYKIYSSQVKDLKREIIFLDNTINQQKQEFLTNFQSFFFRKYGISLKDLDNPLINQPSDTQLSNRDIQEEGEEIDQEALAYIRAKKKVGQLQKARKAEKFK